jgi:zona occludens toxin
MARAAIYDWDGCSVDVHRTKSATTSFWSYPKSAYSLYKSSELHTKQKQKIPAWLVVPVLAIIGGIAVAPQAWATLSGTMTGKGVPKSAKAPETTPGKGGAIDLAGAVLSPLPAASAPVAAASAPVSAVSAPVPQALAGQALAPLEVAGCIVVKTRCGCFDINGKKVPAEPSQCLEDAGVNGIAKAIVQDDPAPATAKPGDYESLAFLRKGKW